MASKSDNLQKLDFQAEYPQTMPDNNNDNFFYYLDDFNILLLLKFQLAQARFKRRVTAMPYLIDQFDFSTAVARLSFRRRATARPNSIHKL